MACYGDSLTLFWSYCFKLFFRISAVRFWGYVAVCMQLYCRCFTVLHLVVAVLHYMFRPTWLSSGVYDVLLLYSWRNLLRSCCEADSLRNMKSKTILFCWVTGLRLALSKGPNRIGFSLLSRLTEVSSLLGTQQNKVFPFIPFYLRTETDQVSETSCIHF
jgi:hypothetical protein